MRGQAALSPRFGTGAQVRGSDVRREIAPALEGFYEAGAHGNEGGVEHQAGAGRAVFTPLLDNVEDALAHDSRACDDPIHRAAVPDLCGTAGEIARPVTERRLPLGALPLEIAELPDIP